MMNTYMPMLNQTRMVMIQADTELLLMAKYKEFLKSRPLISVMSTTSFVKGETITLIITYKNNG